VTAAAQTDADLIARHASGDPQAFSELVRRHRDRMWAVAMRTLRDREEAADALQDAFISAFRAAGDFRAEAQVTTWLHRIVVNACLDRARRKQARPTVPLADGGLHDPATPRDSMSDRETRMVVNEALDQLPEDQRAPIVLVDIEGYSVSETAQLLGIAEGTVKSRCARGRAKLAKVLGHLRNPDAIANSPRFRKQMVAGEGCMSDTRESPLMRADWVGTPGKTERAAP
jgi:RNA polymerase sigma-70 factor, ECF subfamily